MLDDVVRLQPIDGACTTVTVVRVVRSGTVPELFVPLSCVPPNTTASDVGR